MPLSKEEREFLDAYVYEATHEPFRGPATHDLHQRGIHYSDLRWLLTAYDRELSAEGILPFGQENSNPPPSPWPDLQQARLRNQALQAEWEGRIAMPDNVNFAATNSSEQPLPRT